MGVDILANSDPNTNEEDISEIKINEEFARRFEHNKKREALQKYYELKKRGVIVSSDDEESDDEDDENEEEVLVEKDKIAVKYYDALVRVKKGDPIIFEEEEVDEESEEQMEKTKKKKEKPMYLRDVNYEFLNENGAELGEEEIKTNPKVYNKDQAENIKAFLEAAKEVKAESDEEDLFKPKEKDNKDEIDENEEVRQKKLDEYFGEDGNLDENEEFLKNYLRNKMWLEKKKEKDLVVDDVELSEDEEELEKMEEYEAKYNFRHEEVVTDRILGHARHVEGSVRNKESKRKLQRKNKEERIAQAKLQREQELKMLKNLKKKEIKEKLEKFKETAGLGDDSECKLDAKDLEGEFDPEEYDKKMAETFGDDYYGNEDPEPDFGSGEGSNLEKPDFEKEDEYLGLPKDWDVCDSKSGFKALREKHLKMKEDPKEVENEEDGKRKKKRKAKDEKLSKEIDELEKELLEEYYKLNYEDVIAGEIKTRFKYKPVEKNTYGLKLVDIFEADDKKLNQYVSIKKLAPYRETEWKVTKHQKMKKKAILYGEETSGGSKSMKHGGRNNNEDAEEEYTEENEMEDKEEPHGNEDENALSRKKKRKLRKAELKISQARLEAYGVIQSKPLKKNKQT